MTHHRLHNWNPDFHPPAAQRHHYDSNWPDEPSPYRGKQPRYEQSRPSRRRGNLRYLFAGGTMLALVGLLVDVRDLVRPQTDPTLCQEKVQSQSTLSRSELSQLLNVPERGSKTFVRQIVSEPYCLLPSVEIREGAIAEREAYPLEFDPQTWFVILYEGEEYAGYDFVFRR